MSGYLSRYAAALALVIGFCSLSGCDPYTLRTLETLSDPNQVRMWSSNADWYLMMPPGRRNSFDIDKERPLNEWTVAHTFANAQQCEDYRRSLQNEHQGDVVSSPSNLKQGMAASVMASQCIASDDARLAGLFAR